MLKHENGTSDRMMVMVILVFLTPAALLSSVSGLHQGRSIETNLLLSLRECGCNKTPFVECMVELKALPLNGIYSHFT